MATLNVQQVGGGAVRASVMIDSETRTALEELTRMLQRSAHGRVDRNVAVKSAVMHYLAHVRSSTGPATH